MHIRVIFVYGISLSSPGRYHDRFSYNGCRWSLGSFCGQENIYGNYGDKVVKALNDSINIPFINEKTEEKVLGALWSVVVDVLEQILRQ